MSKALFIPLILFFISCSPNKKAQSNSTALSLDEVEIGKDQTGIIGTIQKIIDDDKDFKISVLVDSSQQGGTSGPAISKGANIEIFVTSIFRRQYLENTGNELRDNISENQKALIIITQNQLKKTYNLTHIVL